MTIQTANELKKKLIRSVADKMINYYEIKCEAKARLEKLGCGEAFWFHNGKDKLEDVAEGPAECGVHYETGVNEKQVFCPKHQEEKEIYEEILE